MIDARNEVIPKFIAFSSDQRSRSFSIPIARRGGRRGCIRMTVPGECAVRYTEKWHIMANSFLHTTKYFACG